MSKPVAPATQSAPLCGVHNKLSVVGLASTQDGMSEPHLREVLLLHHSVEVVINDGLDTQPPEYHSIVLSHEWDQLRYMVVQPSPIGAGNP